MFDYQQLLQSMTKGGVPPMNPGAMQAQKPQAVPYAQPPSMGPMMQQAYGMAGQAPQIPQPQMGVPNHPGLPGGAPQIPHMPGGGLPMQDPSQILQMLRDRGLMGSFGGGGFGPGRMM